MQDRPINAFILSMLGSLFVLLSTVLSLTFGVGYSGYYGPYAVFAAVAGFFGAVMLAVSALLYLRPEFHVAWGVTILVLSVASFVSVFTGFAGFGLGVVGMILGIVGGALAIGWAPGTAWPKVPYRVCTACGRPSPGPYLFCPFCGTPVPPPGPPPGAMSPPQPPPFSR